jgi:glycosyltransferase involved in cell wall biosynthesis
MKRRGTRRVRSHRTAPRKESFAVNSVVTVVLPVHNVEGTLRPLVTSILELGIAHHRQLTLAVVDDGSTDDTFETAGDLARDFQQVQAFRQTHQRGLGPALDLVRQRLRITEAIVHDGIGPFDLNQLAGLIDGGPAAANLSADAHAVDHRGSRRFAAVSALNARMADAHRAVVSFHWLKLPETERPRRRPMPTPVVANLGAGIASDMPMSLL